MTPARRLSTSLPAALLLALFSLSLGAPEAGGDTGPAADFAYDVAVGADERDVTFIDQSTVPAPLIRLWDFGDGTEPSTGSSPVHTYGDAGLYDVTLSVTDTMGMLYSVTRPAGVGDRLVVDGFEAPTAPVDWDVVGPIAIETLTPIFGLQSVSVPGGPAQVPVVICSGTFGVLSEAYLSVAVDPSGLSPGDSGFRVLTLVDDASSGTAVAAVRVRVSDPGPELRIWARDTAGQKVQSSYVAVPDLMDQAWIFDVHWRAQTAEAHGTMSLRLYDLQGAQRLGLVLESFDNTGAVFDYVRLGIDTAGLSPSSSGKLLLDRFELRRFSAVPAVD